MRCIILIAHNVRSAHNIGSLLRTCEGLGVQKLYLSGYSPYPAQENDERLPHLAAKINRQIAKTSLGAEKSLSWQTSSDLKELLSNLKSKGYQVVALEQAPGATALNKFKAADKIALVVGNEVQGLENEVLNLCDEIVQIPMAGRKESFNVSAAAAMALYQLRHG